MVAVEIQVTCEYYLVPVQPKQEQCPHPLLEVKLVPCAGQTPSELSCVTSSVCDVHEQLLKAQSQSGGLMVWELKGLISIFEDDIILVVSLSHDLQRTQLTVMWMG